VASREATSALAVTAADVRDAAEAIRGQVEQLFQRRIRLGVAGVFPTLGTDSFDFRNATALRTRAIDMLVVPIFPSPGAGIREQRLKALALHGWWNGHTSHRQNGRREVNHVARIPAQFSTCLDALRPLHNEWRRDTALVHPRLVHPEGRVGDGRPAWAEAQEGLGRSGRCRRIMAVTPNHHLRARPIVRQEHNDGVLERVHGTNLIDHATNLPVHAIDHRRVD
jgi:hypothetical protein